MTETLIYISNPLREYYIGIFVDPVKIVTLIRPIIQVGQIILRNNDGFTVWPII